MFTQLKKTRNGSQFQTAVVYFKLQFKKMGCLNYNQKG